MNSPGPTLVLGWRSTESSSRGPDTHPPEKAANSAGKLWSARQPLPNQPFPLSHLTVSPHLRFCKIVRCVALRRPARPIHIVFTGHALHRPASPRWSILSKEEFNLSRTLLMAALLAVSITAGCKAQPAPPQSSSQDPLSPADLNRRIEIMVRTQFGVPPDYAVALGERKPSQVAGYDALPITISRAGKSTIVNFLISTDNKTLARLETFDLAKNPAFSIDVDGRPIRGNPAAKVTVINFDDLECPYCARMHQSLFPDTIDRYKDQVRFIYKDDPLTELHPWAMHAAVDANCLAAQSGAVYWTYVDYLHSHGQEITGEDRNVTKSYAALDRIARDEATVAKLDAPKLDACLAKQDETQILASRKEADVLGIDGTPAVFVEGERVNGGAVPEEQLWLVIDRALRAAGVQPPAEPAANPPKPAGTGN